MYSLKAIIAIVAMASLAITVDSVPVPQLPSLSSLNLGGSNNSNNSGLNGLPLGQVSGLVSGLLGKKDVASNGQPRRIAANRSQSVPQVNQMADAREQQGTPNEASSKQGLKPVDANTLATFAALNAIQNRPHCSHQIRFLLV
ncbi:hypothetical protein BDF19DRAFT_410498 [Syncephalis fuscata]|nr:hypothetical protein BDF19DRAFT_410498 [Syncephalis fuscata]